MIHIMHMENTQCQKVKSSSLEKPMNHLGVVSFPPQFSLYLSGFLAKANRFQSCYTSFLKEANPERVKITGLLSTLLIHYVFWAHNQQIDTEIFNRGAPSKLIPQLSGLYFNVMCWTNTVSISSGYPCSKIEPLSILLGLYTFLLQMGL